MADDPFQLVKLRGQIAAAGVKMDLGYPQPMLPGGVQCFGKLFFIDAEFGGHFPRVVQFVIVHPADAHGRIHPQTDGCARLQRPPAANGMDRIAIHAQPIVARQHVQIPPGETCGRERDIFRYKTATHRMLDLERRTGIDAAESTLFEQGQQRCKTVGLHGVMEGEAARQPDSVEGRVQTDKIVPDPGGRVDKGRGAELIGQLLHRSAMKDELIVLVAEVCPLPPGVIVPGVQRWSCLS